MTDQTTIQTPDSRLVALLAVSAQIARNDDIAERTSDHDDNVDEEFYLVPVADMRRLRRALQNLSGG